jgi:hypothetical protein
LGKQSGAQAGGQVGSKQQSTFFALAPVSFAFGASKQQGKPLEQHGEPGAQQSSQHSDPG